MAPARNLWAYHFVLPRQFDGPPQQLLGFAPLARLLSVKHQCRQDERLFRLSPGHFHLPGNSRRIILDDRDVQQTKMDRAEYPAPRRCLLADGLGLVEAIQTHERAGQIAVADGQLGIEPDHLLIKVDGLFVLADFHILPG